MKRIRVKSRNGYEFLLNTEHIIAIYELHDCIVIATMKDEVFLSLKDYSIDKLEELINGAQQ